MKTRMLIVDDHPVFLKQLSRSVATDPDWEVVMASGPDEALKKAEDSRPDVILLDCDLGDPVKDGFWVLRELRKNPVFKLLPVLFLSGARVDVDDRVEGLGIGADDYIVKPCDPGVLLARARAALEKSRRQQRLL